MEWPGSRAAGANKPNAVVMAVVIWLSWILRMIERDQNVIRIL